MVTSGMRGVVILAALGASSAFVSAQAPAGSDVRLSAVTANLESGPDEVRIDILNWSTDAVRNQLVDAWNLVPPAPGAVPAGVRGAAGGRGAPGARGARGGSQPPGGRGGRGAGPRSSAGDVAADAAPSRNTPQGALAAALQSLDSVGYIWSSESTGYSIRYAYRWNEPDGSQRVILATDHRLGAWDDSWKSTAGLPPNDAFSILELRLNSKGEGEGKASLTGNVGVDSAAHSIALQGYASLPVALSDVKVRR